MPSFSLNAGAWSPSAVGYRKNRHHGTILTDISSEAPLSSNPDGPGTYAIAASNSGANVTVTDPHSPVVGRTFQFAFMSINNTLDANQIVLTPSAQKVKWGSKTVQALAVYIPEGGVPGIGGPNVYDDAFDIDIGDFSDCPAFMHVYDHPAETGLNTALTISANDNGWVSTNNAEYLEADAQISDSSGTPTFQYWRKFGAPTGSPQPNGKTCSVLALDNYVAFAFYQTVPAISLSASDYELPVHGGNIPKGSTLLSVSGRVFTPNAKVHIAVFGGGTHPVASGPSTVGADGTFTWGGSVFPQLPLGAVLTAVALDTAGLSATTTAEVLAFP